jgi:outer membrane receptor protein involved in Fe transport
MASPSTNRAGPSTSARCRWTEANRMEFVRGAQSTLYGSDAMTSVVQVWTRTGSTPVPEFRFGADGGNFGTANGYASMAGARGRFDYNVFGDQFNTNGFGINNANSDSLQGANVGAALNDRGFAARAPAALQQSHRRARGMEFQRRSAGVSCLPRSQRVVAAQQSSGERGAYRGAQAFRLAAPLYRVRLSLSLQRCEPEWRSCPRKPALRISSISLDHEYDHINRVGFEYQGDYSERSVDAHYLRISHRERKPDLSGPGLSLLRPGAAPESGCAICNSSSRWGRFSA